MDLDKNDVCQLILIRSPKISTLPIISRSVYTKIFEAFHIDSQPSGFIQCKICMRLLSFKSDTWTTIIRHYNHHQECHNASRKKRDYVIITPVQHSLHRLKKFLKIARPPKIDKILEKRTVTSGIEYLDSV